MINTERKQGVREEKIIRFKNLQTVYANFFEISVC